MDFANRYRDNQSSSDDDSEDSDKECNVWKRAIPVKRMAEEENVLSDQMKQSEDIPTNNKRKRNNIWTEVLQDQLISEDFEGCLLKNKPAHYDSRGTESYDYTLKYRDPRVLNDECPMEDEHCDKGEKSYPNAKPKVKKFIKLDSAELHAAKKITKVLNEKKVYLIQRVVKYAGIEKAMKLLAMTEEIEENGGMMINNNARRRTPGGVYLQLLKADKDVTQQVLDKIFESEMSSIELKKYFAEQKKKRKNSKGKKNESKGLVESKESEPHNMVVDAEETNSISTIENSTLENNSVSVPENNSVSLPENNSVCESNPKVSPDNDSELEEGEIED